MIFGSLRSFFILVVFILFIQPVFAIPIPTVTVDAPNEVFVNETFTFTVTLDNTDSTDTGYEPFIDVILPRAGADSTTSGQPVDGISFVSATYLETTLDVTELVFPASGCVTHPLLTNTDLFAVEICDTPENSLLVIELPLSGMSPDFPAAAVEITAFVSDDADLSTPLTFRSRGGFARGADILNNPCCDPFLISAVASDSITPIIMTIAKETNAPENEVPSGDSFDYTFTITVDIADGQTITDLDMTDYMPDNLQFVQILSVVDSSGTTLLFTDNTPLGIGDDLVVTVGSVTGTSNDDDVVIIFEYDVPLDDTSGNPVLDDSTGEGFFTNNTTSALGDWTPNDPRDGATADNATADGTCTDCPGNNAPYVASIAIQKSYAITPDNNYSGASPDDVLTYSFTYQIADSFAYGTVVITDVLGDGQTFINDSAELTFERLGTTTTIDPIVPSTTNNSDGSTTLVFDVSGALVSATHTDGGDLLGACIPSGGDDSNLDCSSTNPTEGTLTYQVTIDEAFTNTDNGNNVNVDHGDEITNEAEIEGILLSPANLVPNPTAIQTNDTTVAFNIVNAPPTKSIYALNGAICSVTNCADQFFFPYDEITYRIQQTIPTSDFEDLQLVDFLPPATFDTGEVTTFSTLVSSDAPIAGVAKYGPNDTANTIISTPTIITETPNINNTLTFDYGTHTDNSNSSVDIDILFTVTVLNAGFADDKLIGNLIQTQEETTNVGRNDSQALVAQPIETPILRTSKGAVATTSTTARFDPPVVGPVSFNPPGSTNAFTDLISSNGLDSNPIESDINNLTAGDIVTFAFVVENVGSAEYGVFDIVLRDDIPDGLVVPTSGANLQIRLGTGDPLTYTNLGDGVNDLFDDGIEVDDFDATTGVCTPYNATSGANLLVVTYDLELASPPDNTVTNTGLVLNYSARDVGVNYLQAGALSTTADAIFGDDDDADDDDLTTADLMATADALTNSADSAIGDMASLSDADAFATQQALVENVQELPALGDSPWSALRQTLFIMLGICFGGVVLLIIFMGMKTS